MRSELATATSATAQATTGRVQETRADAAITLRLRAYNALNRQQVRWFLLTVAIAPGAVAGYWLTQGFWPVLPFAGAEFAALYLALRASRRRGQRAELIRISASEVVISAHPRSTPAKTRFARHWTRVRLVAPQAGRGPERLCLESQGRSREVGSFLTEEERRALAVRLKQLVGDMNDSPELSL